MEDWQSNLYILTALALGAAYLLGSLAPAVWISRSVFRDDVRNHGSGNAGSTNMYRVFGFKAGLSTQIIDIAKGAAAVLLAGHLLRELPPFELAIIQTLCGIAAVAGHSYPVFARFRGGKGVNTILGMMLALHPAGSLVGVAVFVITLVLGRMVSLASMAAVASFPIFLLIGNLIMDWYPWSGEVKLFFWLGVALTAFIVYSHRTNIGRIASGNERKVNIFNKTTVEE